MTEMLDETFRGILRDILYAVRTNPDRRNVDRTVGEAIFMTEKPDELSDEDWDTFVSFMCTGVAMNAEMDPHLGLESIVRDSFERTMKTIFG